MTVEIIKTLDSLASAINQAHNNVELSLKSGLQFAIEAGDLLLQAKQQVQHGSWAAWIAANCRFSERTAQAYMRVAGNRGELEANPQGITGLSFSQALKLLAEPLQSAELETELDSLLASMTVEADQFLTALAQSAAAQSGFFDTDETPLTVPAIPRRANLGELWQLGNHKLLIADSNKPETYSRLLEKERAAAVITDPPYNENINAQWDSTDYRFVPLLQNYCTATATALIFCSLPGGFELHNSMTRNGWRWRSDFVWAKVSGGFKVSDYTPRPSHELIFAYSRPVNRVSELTFNGWDAGEPGETYQKINTSRKGDTQAVYTKPSLELSHSHESGQRWIKSVLAGREKPVMNWNERTTHPTQKPLELVEKLCKLVANDGDLILEPFAGSGTTLIACETTGRTCYAIEREPEYADIIISRFEALTGKEAGCVAA